MPSLTAFNDQPHLTGATVSLRPLAVTGFEDLYCAASDPAIWEQHPKKDRHKRPVFEEYFRFLIESGGTLVATKTTTAKIIGCSRYYETANAPNSISIGYTFLTRDHWGGPTNRAMKTLMFDHAFETFPEVWLHIGTDNLRSQKATEKLGAVYMGTEPMDIVGSNGEMMCYRLSRAGWRARAA